MIYLCLFYADVEEYFGLNFETVAAVVLMTPSVAVGYLSLWEYRKSFKSEHWYLQWMTPGVIAVLLMCFVQFDLTYYGIAKSLSYYVKIIAFWTQIYLIIRNAPHRREQLPKPYGISLLLFQIASLVHDTVFVEVKDKNLPIYDILMWLQLLTAMVFVVFYAITLLEEKGLLWGSYGHYLVVARRFSNGPLTFEEHIVDGKVVRQVRLKQEQQPLYDVPLEEIGNYPVDDVQNDAPSYSPIQTYPSLYNRKIERIPPCDDSNICHFSSIIEWLTDASRVGSELESSKRSALLNLLLKLTTSQRGQLLEKLTSNSENNKLNEILLANGDNEVRKCNIILLQTILGEEEQTKEMVNNRVTFDIQNETCQNDGARNNLYSDTYFASSPPNHDKKSIKYSPPNSKKHFKAGRSRKSGGAQLNNEVKIKCNANNRIVANSNAGLSNDVKVTMKDVLDQVDVEKHETVLHDVVKDLVNDVVEKAIINYKNTGGDCQDNSLKSTNDGDKPSFSSGKASSGESLTKH
uniref:GpcrRhopsn4 domain-containing protein n=1 Tax=Rhabditophanes sp. KR3021 TaxID=114890 RepID=A0AC35U291_9BILA